MPLPGQDQKESYTADEVSHIVAREWAKNEILSLRQGQIDMQRQMIEVTGTISADVKSLRDALITLPATLASQINESRREMRKEMEADFPSRLEAKDMEHRIEKKIDETDSKLGKQINSVDGKLTDLKGDVDKQWIKITAIVVTVISIAGIVQWFIFTAGAAKNLIGG